MPAWFMVQGLTNLGAVADYITLLQKQAAAAVRRERLLKREIAELKANSAICVKTEDKGGEAV